MIKKIGQSFLIFFVLLQFSFIFFSFNLYNEKTENDMINIVMAETKVIFTPQVTIPGGKFDKGTPKPLSVSENLIGEYIVAIYNYAQAIAGILAAIMIAVGGVIWLTAGGNTNKVETAKSYISGALGGLVLLFTSYLLLQNINPALTSMKLTPIKEIKGNNTQYANEYIAPYTTPYTVLLGKNQTQAQTNCTTDCTKKGKIGKINQPNPHNRIFLCYCVDKDSDGFVLENGGVCDTSDAKCASGLYCYQAPSGQQNACFDGSEGDKCNTNEQCSGALACINKQCTDASTNNTGH